MEKHYPYDEISLTVVKKINKKKLFGLILILLLLVALLCYVLYINNNMSELSKKKEDSIINNDINNEMIIGENNAEEKNNNDSNTENSDNVNKNLPTLTQVGRDNMNNLYISDKKIAYLTFDDGPSAKVTPQILDILDRYGIKATFFLLGCNVEKYPNMVQQEYAKGHFIANHGYSHNYDSIYSSPQAVLDEYIRAEQTIRDALGIQEYSSHLFRFPGGSGGKKYKESKTVAKQLLSDNNILYVDWNALTNDAVGHPTRESIISDLISTVGTKNSVVILMHDTGSKQLTADMLPDVINYLIGQGYSFKTFYDVIM